MGLIIPLSLYINYRIKMQKAVLARLLGSLQVVYYLYLCVHFIYDCMSEPPCCVYKFYIGSI